jgi:hypothetical protein
MYRTFRVRNDLVATLIVPCFLMQRPVSPHFRQLALFAKDSFSVLEAGLTSERQLLVGR